MTREVDSRKFGIGDFSAFGIFIFIQFGAYHKPGGGGRSRDQLNNGFKAVQRLASPIERDKGKEAMFNFIPLAGTRWQVANRERNAQGIGQQLQFYLPYSEGLIFRRATPD